MTRERSEDVSRETLSARRPLAEVEMNSPSDSDSEEVTSLRRLHPSLRHLTEILDNDRRIQPDVAAAGTVVTPCFASESGTPDLDYNTDDVWENASANGASPPPRGDEITDLSPARYDMPDSQQITPEVPEENSQDVGAQDNFADDDFADYMLPADFEDDEACNVLPYKLDSARTATQFFRDTASAGSR